MAEDLGDKTEPATQRRRQDERKRGSVPRSQDLAGAIGLLGAVLAIIVFAPGILRDWQAFMEQTLSGRISAEPFHHEAALNDAAKAVGLAIKVAGPFLLAMVAVSYIGLVWQVGLLLSFEPLRPSLNKLSPMSGLKKLFGVRSLAKAGTNIGKVVAVLLVAAPVIAMNFREVLALPYLEFAEAVVVASKLVVELAFWLTLTLIILGLIDFAYQKWQWEQDHKMTKQEVKDELKQLQGDPAVKSRQRGFARKIMQQRLNQSVPTADVIVTNPEHLAIALKYDSTSMHAPRVVAKGADYMALRIRQIAALHGVPIIERKPLARAMYPAVEVGQEIPPQFYAAIAEVLAYVYQLNGRKAG
ncbi:MAG: flagellar biosynthesis protein FlhB [Phycisphaerales bacterium]